MCESFSLNDNPSAKNNPNIVSKIFFVWMLKFFYQKHSTGLFQHDLFKTSINDQSNALTNKLEKLWEDEITYSKECNKNPSMLRALRKMFLWEFMMCGFVFLIIHNLRLILPSLLGNYIKLFGFDATPSMLSMYVSGMLLVSICFSSSIVRYHVVFHLQVIGLKCRIATTAMVYRKFLRLKPRLLTPTTTGKAINLLCNDLFRFDTAIGCLHNIWIQPIQFIGITYLLWELCGVSYLCGFLFLVLIIIPLQNCLVKVISIQRLKMAVQTDERLKLINEAITGIKVIKLFTWENAIEKVVTSCRQHELDFLSKIFYCKAATYTCRLLSQKITYFLTLACFILLGYHITPEKMFKMGLLFFALTLSIANLLPQALTNATDALVALRRLEQFLLLEEQTDSHLVPLNSKDIVLENVEASWIPPLLTLNKFSLQIPYGSFCAVIGPVGAGKSSLLNVLLGELPPIQGEIKMHRSISYASQKTWLYHSSIKNNILFGEEFEEMRYKNVIRICGLEADLEQLPQGHETLVGEQGISLSGGQKSRINLARAVYCKADIYIFDDPLCSVNHHIGKYIFETCMMEHLSGKTRILVTHQISYAEKTDFIIVLDKGNLRMYDTSKNVINTNLNIPELVQETDTNNKIDVNYSDKSIDCILDDNPRKETTLCNNIEPDKKINLAILMEYLKFAKCKMLLVSLFIIFILGEISLGLFEYWLAYWVHNQRLRYEGNVTYPNKASLQTVSCMMDNSTNDLPITDNSFFNNEQFFDHILMNGTIYRSLKKRYFLGVDGFLLCISIAFMGFYSFMFYKVSIRVSKNIHKTMFTSILEVPFNFFNEVSSGKILNRFSRDIAASDEQFSQLLSELLRISVKLTVFLFMVVIANYIFVIYVAVFVVTIGSIIVAISKTTVQVKNLETKAISPMITLINATLDGIATIRARRKQNHLKKQFEILQNTHTSTWYLKMMCSASFGFLLDMCLILFLSCIIFTCNIMFMYKYKMNDGMVGLTISQTMGLFGIFQMFVFHLSEIINQITSVKRVIQFTKLQKEASVELISRKQQKSVAKVGKLEFVNVSLSYFPNEAPILKNVSFVIKHGEKVGIVGKTGAGKSSLITALFRLAPINGQIFIDGVNTKTIALKCLRKKISIIPQEPVLFSTTIRYNLDPFSEYTDNQLWKALAEAELKNCVPSLDLIITDGGSNFSQGQKQLICLARAILRKNKILVMDEPTANIDSGTEVLIQSTIRKKFTNCTVLTIAHRLKTIVDSDKVLVIENGSVVEFDKPSVLMENSDGYFYNMFLNKTEIS